MCAANRAFMSALADPAHWGKGHSRFLLLAFGTTCSAELRHGGLVKQVASQGLQTRNLLSRPTSEKPMSIAQPWMQTDIGHPSAHGRAFLTPAAPEHGMATSGPIARLVTRYLQRHQPRWFEAPNLEPHPLTAAEVHLDTESMTFARSHPPEICPVSRQWQRQPRRF